MVEQPAEVPPLPGPDALKRAGGGNAVKPERTGVQFQPNPQIKPDAEKE